MYNYSKESMMVKSFTSIQVEYISEVATEVDVQQVVPDAPDFHFQTIDKTQFNDNAFWDILFGNDYITLNSGYQSNTKVHAVENPHVRFLTSESRDKILEFRLQFSNGIDFEHLPAGFVLAKNPLTGICDVLHYNKYYAIYQPVDENRPLAIVLTDKTELNESLEPKPRFKGHQATWYNFLQSKRISNTGEAYCTEDELNAAFIRFSNIISSKGLFFFQSEWSESLADEVNPIVLIGRWETVMSNPHLKKADIQKQWSVLPQLPLVKSNAAIRAITDYTNDERPCGFLLPEMQLDSMSAIDCNDSLDGSYRLVSNKKDARKSAMFWRNISYQSKRNSIGFYEEALKTMDKAGFVNIRDLCPGMSLDLMTNVLSFCAIALNHTAHTNEEELQELGHWNRLCDNLMKSGYPSLNISYLDNLRFNIPNTRFLGSYVEYLSSLSSLQQEGVESFSNTLSFFYYCLGESFYSGARFYFLNDDLSKIGIKEYIHLLGYLYRQTGGKNQVETFVYNTTGLSSDFFKLSQQFILLAPHLSTFNLDSEEAIQQVMTKIRRIDFLASKAWDERWSICLHILKDVKHNKGLNAVHLIELMNYIDQEVLSKEPWQLNILSYLEEHFSNHFEDMYFEKKKEQLLEASHGLTQSQKDKIQGYGFSQPACEALISLESEIVKACYFNVDGYLNDVHEKLHTLKHVLTKDDFILFIKQLNDMRFSIVRNYHALPELIALIIKKRTLGSFNQLVIRNEIEHARENILEKFILFMNEIQPLTQDPNLKLNSLMLQEAMATVVLNSNIKDVSRSLTKVIPSLLTQLNDAAIAHPHIKHYLLDCLNYISDKETLNYLNHVKQFGDSVQQLTHLLESNDPGQAKNNMLVIYSLFAHFHKQPSELSRLVTQVSHLPLNQQAFMMMFVSRLLDNNQSIEQLDALIDLVHSDDNKWTLFSGRCLKPPCPSIEQISEWLTNNTFEEQYEVFSLKPYGERQLNNVFNLKQYERQRSLFVGVKDIFTPEVGQSIYMQLERNRVRSMHELTQSFNALRKKGDLDHAMKLELVCLSVEIMARTSSQWSQQADSKRVSQELNTTQVMALYAKMVNPGHRLISQIDTGEGKSRIMMILAACQAAQGKTVDFLTSDAQLKERDYLSYKQFFTALGIPTSLLALDTPSYLYQKGGVNFADRQLLLLRNRADIERQPFAYMDEDAKNRCLLVDEVDQLIHDSSGDSHNYAAQAKRLADFVWIYPKLMGFVSTLSIQSDMVFDAKEYVDAFMDYVDSNELNDTYKANLAQLSDTNPAQIITWLQSAVKALNMRPNEHYIMSQPDKDKLFLVRDHLGHTRYSRKIFVYDNGRPDVSSTYSNGVHQCICAKENMALHQINNNQHDDFVILPENETQRASFPVTFMSRYAQGSIYGVSGTTRSAAPLSGDPAINHEEYAYLTMPREHPLIREDKNVWLACDEEQQIQFIKRSILKKIREGGAVLLVCKNDEQSRRLHDALNADSNFKQSIKNIQHVHGLTDKQHEEKAIRNAGSPGVVTISTAGMLGRGVDIHDQSNYLAVLSAYVPSEDEEIQIKGRTARHGKPGEYRMIPNMSDADNLLNGATYNVHNEVIKLQRQRQRESGFQREVSSLYAFFIEDITEQFLAEWDNLTQVNTPVTMIAQRLETWQILLGNIQKDWLHHREKLLVAVNEQNEVDFSAIFNAFTNKWIEEANDVALSMKINSQKQACDVSNVYKSLMAQQRFFNPSRQPIPVQRDYDPSDDGQARVYSTLFPKTWATLTGERRLFADFHAWHEGRGELFPDFMAVLNGERDLFANLYATISRWITEITAWLNTTDMSSVKGVFGVDEDDLNLSARIGT